MNNEDLEREFMNHLKCERECRNKSYEALDSRREFVCEVKYFHSQN